jgi:spore coat protein H
MSAQSSETRIPKASASSAFRTSAVAERSARSMGLAVLRMCLTAILALPACGSKDEGSSKPGDAQSAGQGGTHSSADSDHTSAKAGRSATDIPSSSARTTTTAGAAAGGNAGSAGAGGGAGVASSTIATAGTSNGGRNTIGDPIFSQESVIEYRLTVADSDIKYLDEHGDEEKYVPATASVTSSTFARIDLGKIGVRYKGDVTLHSCWDSGTRSHEGACQRLSYKLKFDEYVTDTRLFGLKRLNLHVSYADPTRLREMLAQWLFSAFGITTARAAPAAVYVNDSLVGLFIAVEEVDGRFTARHFPDGGDGNLYKEAWPISSKPDSYFADALSTNNGTSADISDIKAFAAAVAGLNASNFDQALSSWLDIDYMLRYMAVDRAIKNWDGITAFYNPDGPHNFFFYHDDGTRKLFHLIPWDFNGASATPGTFIDSDPYMDPGYGVNTVPNVNVAPTSCQGISIWGIAGDPGMGPPGCDPLLRYLMQTQWSRWVTIGQELLAGPMARDQMQARIDALRALIEPTVARDSLLQAGAWSGAVEALPKTIENNRTAFQALMTQGYRIE